MPFNYNTGQYDPDPTDFSGWFIKSDPGLDTTQAAAGTNPSPNAPGPANPTGYPPPNQIHEDPSTAFTHYVHPDEVPNPTPAGSNITTLPLPQGPVSTGNPGNDPNNPPGPGYFWSGTGQRWVDPTGKHDATGRELTTGEQTYWHQFDTTRAQNTAQGINSPLPPMAGMPGQLPANGATPAGVVAPVPTAASAPAQTSTALQAGPNYDYSKPFTVPGSAFEKNVFADSNAQQSFKELQGVLTPDQLKVAQQQYGWQPASQAASPDANQVYQEALRVATADPNSDYSIVKVQASDGSINYGIVKRENGGGNVAAMQQAQTARGFISPAVAIAMAQARQQNSGGGGGGGVNRSSSYGNGSGNGSGGGLPKPGGAVAQQTGHTLPPPQPSGEPINYGNVDFNHPINGQITMFNGQRVQYVNGRWVPYGTASGGQQHPVAM